MNPKNKLFHFVLIGFLLLSTGCDKTDKDDSVAAPQVTTFEVSEITSSTAQGGGNILKRGGSHIESKGLVWSTRTYPTINSPEGISFGDKNFGSFYGLMSELSSETEYFARAWVTIDGKTYYGNEVSFKTKVYREFEPPECVHSDP